jgi:cell division septum initiation protein DivIVA
MNENSDFLPNLSAAPDEDFEVQLRGYSRRQVDDFVARCRSQARENEERLNRALDEAERLRQEVKALRQQALGSRPAHEEVSERISQILKLADDEAQAQKSRAEEDISKQRADAQAEAERVRKEAREQAEQMLTAAQEQAERAISSARSEAEKTRTAARTEADHTTADARKKADNVLSTAKAQAKQTLDEATARATAIHDGAERRLNLLSTRHAETIRRLTEILDGVSGLVASETSRLSLEDEVEQTVAKAIGQQNQGDGAAPAAPAPDGAPVPAGNPPRGAAGTPTPGGPGAPAQPARAGNPLGGPTPAPGGPGGPGGQPAPGGPGGQTAAPAAPRGQAGPSASAQAQPPSKPGPSGTAPLPAARVVQESAQHARPAEPAPRGDRPAGGPNGTVEHPRPAASPASAEDSAARQHNASGARHTAASFTGSIDPDEPAEGVRIVRDQRHH